MRHSQAQPDKRAIRVQRPGYGFDCLKTLLGFFSRKPKTSVISLMTVFVLLTLVLSLINPWQNKQAHYAQAATQSTIGFQARLYNANGSVVPDGYYNIEFKLYNQSSGGSALWTETYYDSNGASPGNDNRLRVVNGYLSAPLGSLTAFSGIDWDQEHWVTLNVGGSNQTATPTYDGEMTPRLKLTAVPYALKAGTAANVRSNDTNSASTNSDNITIQSGNAAGATSNSGNITLDVGTATQTAGTISIGTANTSGITIGRTGVTTSVGGNLSVTGTSTLTGATTVAGLLTANGNLTLQTGDTFTINGDALTDLTGTGLTVTSGALTVDNSALDDSFFIQGGNSFGATAVIGTNDNNNFSIETNNAVVATFTTAGQLQLPTTGSGGGILLGGDANLYRGSADSLVTDDSFSVGGSLNLNGTFFNLTNTGVINIGDTNLYRSAADTLRTNDALTVDGLLTGSLGANISGATTNINASSNFATNINTGTSTGAVAIGNNTGNTAITIDSGTSAINIGTGAQARSVNIGTGGAAQTLTLGSTNTTSTTTIQGGSGGINLSTGSSTGDIAVGANMIAQGASTGTTATTSGTGTNTTTLTFSGTTSFANNDVLFIDNAGQDYYTRIVSGGNSASVTVSPAITFETGRTVTKYTVQNIGSSTSGEPSSNNERFYQGYFLGGIVAGAGSTHYADGSILFQGDTNLYRSGANSLKTDDAFTVGGTQFTNMGSTLNNTLPVSNDADGGSLGGGLAASASVDIYTSFSVGQTTAGQTISLPNPTDTTAGRVVYVFNTGSTSFTMHSITILSGYGQQYVWNGSAWILASGGTAASLNLQAAYDGGNTISTTNARNLTVTLANTATDGNLVVNVASGSTGALKVQNNGTDVLSIGSSGQLVLSVQGSSGGLLIGGDTNLYRGGADILQTADSFYSGGAVCSFQGSSNQICMTAFGVPLLSFGSGGDVSLLRGAADILSTYDALRVGSSATTYLPGDLGVSRNAATTTGAIYFGSGGNYVYYNGSNFQTSDDLSVTGTLYSSGNLSTGGGVTVNAGGLTVSAGTVTVSSTIQVDTLGGAGAAHLCRNGANVISGCTSSQAYKHNIEQIDDTNLDRILTEISSTPIFNYEWNDGSPGVRTGVISEYLPENLTPTLDQSGHRLPDWFSVYGYLWAGEKAIVNKLDLMQSDFTTENLTVTTAATIADLTVTGDANFESDITVGGHVISAGNQPEADIALASGDNATVSVDGNDTAGTITIELGDNNLASGELAWINFVQQFSKAPKVIITPQNDYSAGAHIYPSNKSNGNFSLNSSQSLVANKTLKFDYFIVE